MIARAGTLTRLVDVITGLTSITNADDAVLGHAVESDATFRTRSSDLREINALSSIESIRAAVLLVSDVASCTIYENTGASDQILKNSNILSHSILPIVSGAATESIAGRTAIAAAIRSKLPAGTRTGVGTFKQVNWRRSPGRDLSTQTIETATGDTGQEIAGTAVKSDGTTVAVFILGSRKVRIFVNGVHDPLQDISQSDVEAAVGGVYAGGMTWLGDELYLLGGSTGQVAAFRNGTEVSPPKRLTTTPEAEGIATDGSNFYVWSTTGVTKWSLTGTQDTAFNTLTDSFIQTQTEVTDVFPGGMYWKDGTLYLGDQRYDADQYPVFAFDLTGTGGTYNPLKNPIPGIFEPGNQIRGLSEANGVMYVGRVNDVQAVSVETDNIEFSEPVDVPIRMDIRLRLSNQFPSDGLLLIKNGIVDYVSSLGSGSFIDVYEIAAQIYAVVPPPICRLTENPTVSRKTPTVPVRGVTTDSDVYLIEKLSITAEDVDITPVA